MPSQDGSHERARLPQPREADIGRTVHPIFIIILLGSKEHDKLGDCSEVPAKGQGVAGERASRERPTSANKAAGEEAASLHVLGVKED